MQDLPKFQRNRRSVNVCPCGKDNRDEKFAPFVGYEDKGFCHSCGVTFMPDMPESDIKPEPKQSKPEIIKHIDQSLMRRTMTAYHTNNFAKVFTTAKDNEEWALGTTKDGSVIFWLVDENKNICSAKKAAYLPTGKRDKSTYPIHLFKNKDGYKPCLFGLHRMFSYNTKTIICLVESEKSAIVATHHYPEYLWIATGGATGFTKRKANPLRQREILLFIDCDKAGRNNAPKTVSTLNEIGCKVRVIDLCPDKEDGTDVADILIYQYTEINSLNIILWHETRANVNINVPETHQHLPSLAIGAK